MTMVDDRVGDTTGPHTAVRVQDPAVPAMRWLQVESGFWVANVDGNFGGTIEQDGDRLHARDAMGVEVGEFTDVASAKRAVGERLSRESAGPGIR